MTSELLLAVLFACVAAAPPPVRDDTAFAFIGVTVLPMTSDTALPNMTVVVRDGLIERVGPANLVPVPEDARRIDGSGKYLLPALADMHTHVWNEKDVLFQLAAGVTLVRNMAGSPYHLELRRRIRAGEILGPELYTAGPIMDGPGGPYGTWTDPDSAGAAVLRQAEAGYDFVKVYERLSPEVYRAIIEAANRSSLPVVGHVSSLVGMEEALRLGQRSIEHVYPYTDEVSRRSVASLPRHLY